MYAKLSESNTLWISWYASQIIMDTSQLTQILIRVCFVCSNWSIMSHWAQTMSMNTHVQSLSTIRVQLQSLPRRCDETAAPKHKEVAPRKSKTSHLAPTSEFIFQNPHLGTVQNVPMTFSVLYLTNNSSFTTENGQVFKNWILEFKWIVFFGPKL